MDGLKVSLVFKPRVYALDLDLNQAEQQWGNQDKGVMGHV